MHAETPPWPRPHPLARLEELLSVDPRDTRDVARHTLIAIGIAWIPIMLIALVERFVTGAWDPFVRRSEVHVRLLLCVPILQTGAASFSDRFATAARHIEFGEVIAPKWRGAWTALIKRHLLASDALRPKLYIVAGIAALTIASYSGALPLWVLRWLAPSIHEAGVHAYGHTPAWWWYVVIGQPCFLYALGHWLFRWGLWTLSLWKLPRHEPQMQPVHADRTGGLGFLTSPLFSYRFFAFSLGAALASVWFDEIGSGSASPRMFVEYIFGLVVIDLVLAFVPYLMLTPILIRAKRMGEWTYSVLQRRYVDAFEKRWIFGEKQYDPTQGSEDIQGLTDLGTSVAIVNEMKTQFVTRSEAQTQLIAAVSPFLPIVFVYVVPAGEILWRVTKRFIGG